MTLCVCMLRTESECPAKSPDHECPLSSFIGGIGASRESRVAGVGDAGFVRTRWAVVRSMDA